MSRLLQCLILVIFFSSNMYSQNLHKNQELFLEAEYFLMFEDYSDALPIYLKLQKDYPDNYNLSYKIGLCYLNINGQKEKSVKYLEEAAENSSAIYREGSLKQTSAPNIAWYDLGNSYRVNYMFNKAKAAFQRYSQSLLSENTEDKLFIDHQIEVCDNAKEIISKPIEFSEENIGELFNDGNSNFHPVISNDGNSMVFMSKLKFYDAIFFTQKVKNRWVSPINIIPEIQLDGDLYVSCLADNGNTLYFSQVLNDESNIFKSTYNGSVWSVAEKLDKNISSKYWDSHAFIYPDGKTMIFASDRPGGFGGLDLYKSTQNEEGYWSTPVNLGPEVNTAFNEDRPFISTNGKTLFFCSQGHYNMGGFDLFKTDIMINGHWTTPVNLGYPVNTPDDDTFFMPVNEGMNGYISAFREGKGYGKEDIFYITFK